jgi:hypothetical protein
VDEPRFREFELSQRHVDHRVKLHPFRSKGSMVTMNVVAHLSASATVTTHAEWEATQA